MQKEALCGLYWRPTTLTSIRPSLPALPKPRSLRRVWIFFVLGVNLLVCAYTLGVYRFVHISPADFWPAGFLTLSLPIAMLLHVAFGLYWLWFSPPKALFSLVVVLVGYPYWQRTLTYHAPGPVAESLPSFEVLSYNVRMLNTYHERLGVNASTSTKMLDWLIEHDADIKCVQELYNADTSRVYNSMKQLYFRQKHPQYATPPPDLYESRQGYVGVVIFSKFPILRYEKLVFDRSGINKGVVADIAVGKDTIRVFNVHLQSMSIRVKKVLSEREYERAKKDLADIFRRLKRGFVSRAEQVDLLEKRIAASPYKVIVCGDLNDMPYGYTYSKLRKRLRNAFEEAGNGFGFTYNDKLFFLRIDNQFCDPRFSVRDFTTHREVDYSDHFPVSAVYSLE
ncbi:MAG: endonuclease/exonuclease/phosphatase family protein [Ferruginibacter sp.]|nr:endonuclease/exonuclease/phosphatase family protein [Cytophagales bacterium]